MSNDSTPSSASVDDQEFLDDFDLDSFPVKEPDPRPDLDDPRVGMFPGIDPLVYFADPIEEGSLSNSGIKVLQDESPLDFAFQHPRLNPDYMEKVADTVAKRRGDIVHQLALGKGRGFAVGPFDSWRTKESKVFRAEAEKAGETPILKHQFDEAKVMAEVIVERVKRVLDGADYETEVGIIWIEETPAGPIYMRGLIDIWCRERAIILDPKITANLGDGRPGEEKINRHAVNMGWDYQAGLYTRGVERLNPDLEGKVRFGNLMIKPSPPFTSRLLWPDFVARRTALFECRPTIQLFAECLHAGKWPGYPEGGESLSLPTFVENRRLDAEIQAHG